MHGPRRPSVDFDTEIIDAFVVGEKLDKSVDGWAVALAGGERAEGVECVFDAALLSEKGCKVAGG